MQTHLAAYVARLRALDAPSPALVAYIDGVAARVRLNAEDWAADDWAARSAVLDARCIRRWEALTAADQQRARSVA